LIVNNSALEKSFYCPYFYLHFEESMRVTPSLLLSHHERDFFRHPHEQISQFFQDSPTMRTDATNTAVKKASEQFFNHFSSANNSKNNLIWVRMPIAAYYSHGSIPVLKKMGSCQRDRIGTTVPESAGPVFMLVRTPQGS
jgi:hypothetical protein